MTPVSRLGALLLCLGFALPPLPAAGQTVRILQTSAAGDDIQIIDPATNKIVGEVRGIPIPHGATSHPDGSTFYFTNEVQRTVDIVPVATLKVAQQIPLSGRPNNLAILPDGSKIYVAIRYFGTSVDVIDTRSHTLVKTIPVLGGVHNVFVTPDGKWAVAGMIDARTMTVIDTRTDTPAWSLHMNGGVRPMAFETNPDGSTKRAFVQISDFHGFYVVDWATRTVTDTVRLPELPLNHVDDDALQNSPAHGLAVSPDGKVLWSTSKPNDHLYAFSLADLKLIGSVHVGRHPDWLTFTPDGKLLYSANAGSNDVSVIDTGTMKEVVRIPVGQVPKRNYTAVLR